MVDMVTGDFSLNVAKIHPNPEKTFAPFFYLHAIFWSFPIEIHYFQPKKLRPKKPEKSTRIAHS